MTSTSTSNGLRRTTGGLFVFGAIAFATAATVLSSTFNWPDILREPGAVVLPAIVAGGTSLVWTWFATAWRNLSRWMRPVGVRRLVLPGVVLSRFWRLVG